MILNQIVLNASRVISTTGESVSATVLKRCTQIGLNSPASNARLIVLNVGIKDHVKFVSQGLTTTRANASHSVHLDSIPSTPNARSAIHRVLNVWVILKTVHNAMRDSI